MIDEHLGKTRDGSRPVVPTFRAPFPASDVLVIPFDYIPEKCNAAAPPRSKFSQYSPVLRGDGDGYVISREQELRVTPRPRILWYFPFGDDEINDPSFITRISFLYLDRLNNRIDLTKKRLGEKFFERETL